MVLLSEALSSRPALFVIDGLNPGTPSDALKSEKFSDRSTKSRMAGSVAQARRSAARVTSGGTPGSRNGRMSEPGPIVSIGGNRAALKRATVAGSSLAVAVLGVSAAAASERPLERM